MQEKLVEILRHKGIGPKGSKQLNSTDIEEVEPLLMLDSCHLTTKATFLTALLLLDQTIEEEELVNRLKEKIHLLPKELYFLLSNKGNNVLENNILKLIDRVDLTEEEAQTITPLFFKKETPDHLKASFLEALRLKRETDTENKVFYTYFLNQINHQEIDCDPIIEICDSFDGVQRNHNFDLFAGCVLAAMGYKVVLTGCETVAPKKGITHHQLLKFANKNPKQSKEKAVNQLIKSGICYLDQSVFDPNFWAMQGMRTNMVKRPFLATFEKILSPIVSIKGNYVATSYTHVHYKNANIEIFKSSPYIFKALNIKGLEGTIQVKHNISTPVLLLKKDMVTESNYKFIGTIEAESTEINVERCLALALDFLENNSNNQAKNYVINTICMLLLNFELETNQEIVMCKIEAVLNNKTAFEVWNKIE